MMSRKITEKVIRRLRAVPRVVTISGDVGFSTPLEEDFNPDRITKPDPGERTLSPKVILSANYRPERESELPVTVFTSVSESMDKNQFPRINVPRNKKGLRVGPIDIKRKNSNDETSHSTQDYAPEIQDDIEILDEMSMELLDRGIKIKSGQHLFVDLEESSIDDSRIISIEGDQAVRVVFTTNSGHLITSSEIPQHVLPHQLNIPINSRIIYLFGYGDISESSNHLNLGSNSISLNCSTDNTTAVGFQAQSRIIGIPNTLLICRGGVVRFDNLTTDYKNSIRARSLLKGAKVVTFETGGNAETFIVILNSSAVETAVYTHSGVELKDPFESIENGALTALIWNLPTSGNQINKFTVSTELKGSVHSLMAMKGKAEIWADTMMNQYWDTIVEEGALTNEGTALIKISNLENGKDMEEEKYARR
jgi:hypothetical protein